MKKWGELTAEERTKVSEAAEAVRWWNRCPDVIVETGVMGTDRIADVFNELVVEALVILCGEGETDAIFEDCDRDPEEVLVKTWDQMCAEAK